MTDDRKVIPIDRCPNCGCQMRPESRYRPVSGEDNCQACCELRPAERARRGRFNQELIARNQRFSR